MTKLCGMCKIIKPISEFSKKRTMPDGTVKYQYQCKLCHKEYRKLHYELNRTKYIRKARKWGKTKKIERRDFLLDYYLANPCKDCGETNPAVLEFDHVAGSKLNDVSQLLTSSDDVFFSEIKKCEVVCSNCHRKRTVFRDKRHWLHNKLCS